MRFACAARFTPPNCVLEAKAAASHPPAFAVLCRVVAEFNKSLFRRVFKAKPLRAAGFRAKSEVCGNDESWAGDRSREGNLMKSARALSLGSTPCLAVCLAVCLDLALCTFTSLAWAQFPAPPGGTQCSDFAKLTAEAQKRSNLVSAAMKAKADRKELCTLMTNFVAAETSVVKFLEANKVWCGVPDDAITVSKANHEKSMKFRTMACSEEGQPRPKAPSLSDAIKAPSVDTAKNTKTGRGTFDTLTGNPLGR
jgi:hypothetical protein